MFGAWQQPEGHLRDMTEADLPQVVPIERRVYPFPWPTDFFRFCLHEGFVCRILEQDGMILGYGILMFERDWAHILNLCVRPESQGRGLGTRLLRHLLNLARRHRAHYVLLEVRPSNYAARTLYQRMGFVGAGVRKNYYPATGGHEDAIIMTREL